MINTDSEVDAQAHIDVRFFPDIASITDTLPAVILRLAGYLAVGSMLGFSVRPVLSLEPSGSFMAGFQVPVEELEEGDEYTVRLILTGGRLMQIRALFLGLDWRQVQRVLKAADQPVPEGGKAAWQLLEQMDERDQAVMVMEASQVVDAAICAWGDAYDRPEGEMLH